MQSRTTRGASTRWWETVTGEPPAPKQTLSLVGAGGKTTLLFALAHELTGRGFRSAVTTTTHIFYPDAAQCRRVVTDNDRAAVERGLADGPVTVGVPAQDGKLACPPQDMLQFLARAADFVLIEADGSHRLPVKVPRQGEPVLYAGTDLVAAVCGVRCIGQPLDAVCHRAALARELLGVEGDHRLTPADAATLLYRSYAGCARRVTYVLNQADEEAQRALGAETAQCLLALGAARVAVTSFVTGRADVFTP